MDNSSLAGNRQTLLMAVAVTGLTLAIAFSIQPLLPLSDSGQNAAEVDPLGDLDEPVFAEPTEEPSVAESDDAPESVGDEIAALEDAPVALPPGAEVPERFVRRRAYEVEGPAALENADTVMPPPYQQRLALLNDEHELRLRRVEREAAASAATEASETPHEPASIAMVSVEEAPAGEAPVVRAVAHATDTQEFKRVKLVRHNPLRSVSETAEPARGAWLAGTIELD
jgi:hypothetical protein